MRFNETVTAARVRELLHYDAETGILTWRKVTSNRAKVGSTAGANSRGYIRLSIDDVEYTGSRIIWLYVHGRWPNTFIDHVNGDPRDNRLVNLREVTRAQNQANTRRPSNNTSGIKGVSFFARDKKWRATIRIGGVVKNLGHYDTKEEAAAVYRAAAVDLRGEYARLQ